MRFIYNRAFRQYEHILGIFMYIGKPPRASRVSSFTNHLALWALSRTHWRPICHLGSMHHGRSPFSQRRPSLITATFWVLLSASAMMAFAFALHRAYATWGLRRRPWAFACLGGAGEGFLHNPCRLFLIWFTTLVFSGRMGTQPPRLICLCPNNLYFPVLIRLYFVKAWVCASLNYPLLLCS